MELPKELEVYRKEIEGTLKPVIKVRTSNRKNGLYCSKFAGLPYMPKSMTYPTDSAGKPMKLLAQLNFEEVPTLDPLPKQGILQFFIAVEDDVMGADFDDLTNQKNFKVLFHDTIERDITQLRTDFSHVEELDASYFPIGKEAALHFSVEHEPVCDGVFNMDELLGEGVNLHVPVDEKGEKELWESYSDTFSGEGHKMLGYPCFAQNDPREWDKHLQEYNLLLLQIDSDYENEIEWGDSGVANFFIKEDDLRNRNFSNILYNWDCC